VVQPAVEDYSELLPCELSKKTAELGRTAGVFISPGMKGVAKSAENGAACFRNVRFLPIVVFDSKRGRSTPVIV
jgi:hypothetical protein